MSDNIEPDELAEAEEVEASEPSAEELQQQAKYWEDQHKGIRRELQKLRSDNSRLVETIDLLGKSTSRVAPKEPEPELPDPDKDPGGFLRNIHSEVRQIRDETAAERAARKQQEALDELGTSAASDVASRALTEPAYAEAADYLDQHLTKTFRAMGATTEQAAALVRRQGLSLALKARQTGQPVSELVLETAKEVGFSPTRPKRKTAETHMPEDNSELDNVVSLNRKPDSAPPPSAASLGRKILKMSDDEYMAFKDRLVEKHGGDESAADREIQRAIGHP